MSQTSQTYYLKALILHQNAKKKLFRDPSAINDFTLASTPLEAFDPENLYLMRTCVYKYMWFTISPTFLVLKPLENIGKTEKPNVHRFTRNIMV